MIQIAFLHIVWLALPFCMSHSGAGIFSIEQRVVIDDAGRR